MRYPGEECEDYSECITLGTALKMGGDPEFRDCGCEKCSKYCSEFNGEPLPKKMEVKLSYGISLLWKEDWADTKKGITKRTFLLGGDQ